MKEIWVYAECMNQSLATSFYELVSKAKQLSGEMKDAIVCAVVLENSPISIVEQVKKSGVEKIYVMEHPLFQHYNLEALSAAFDSMVKTYQPEMVLIAASAIGSELAPTVAGKARTGLAAHCVDIRYDSELKRINCMVPAFGGKVISEIYVPDARPVMASVRPGILEAVELEAKNAEVINVDNKILNEIKLQEEFVELEEYELSGQSLESASFVMAAGRGINAEAYSFMQEIAKKREAAIGYTRSFVDIGMVNDETDLIGTSGKSVKPKVLLEFGISGAVHYISGINKSKCIISINSDEKAKIFDYSDYGVVADATEILRELAKKF